MDDLDRILSAEEILTPSAGFAAGVMDAVRQTAAEPEPLAFPWGRFATGLVACGAWALAATQLVSRIELETSIGARLAALSPDIGYALGAIAVGLCPLFARRILARD